MRLKTPVLRHVQIDVDGEEEEEYISGSHDSRHASMEPRPYMRMTQADRRPADEVWFDSVE